MTRCYITDRRTLPPGETLLDVIARNLAAGVEMIQIREKDLSARELFRIVRDALALDNPLGTRIVVNSRTDVALAAGAGGVHLPAGSPAARVVGRTSRSAVGQPILSAATIRGPQAADKIGCPTAGFIIGVSCHIVDEVRAAESEGASYVLFGPVFTPVSKSSDLAPRGLEQLAQAARTVRIPVLALGGVTRENAAACVEAGAAGVAGISLFQNCRGSC